MLSSTAINRNGGDAAEEREIGTETGTGTERGTGKEELLSRAELAWSKWCAKVAQVQHRRGSYLWRKLREQLELVGETAHFLYGEAGTELRCAYAKQTEVQTAVEYQDLADIERSEKLAETRRCFLHPNRWCRTCWDVLIVWLLVYVAMIIPYRIGFFVAVQPGDTRFAVDVVCDALFVVDIVLNFRTGRIAQSGVLVSDGRLLAKHYLRSWFAVDFLSCLPVTYIVLLTSSGSESAGGQGGSSTKTIKLLRLLRCAPTACSDYCKLNTTLRKATDCARVLRLYHTGSASCCGWHD